MTTDTDNKLGSSGLGSQVHLIDLLTTDCCHTERVSLELRLRRLEQSLDTWLHEKIAEIESENPSVPIVGQVYRDLEIARNYGHPMGQKEVIPVSTDNRDILDVLQAELDFIEKGGYGRSPRTPWKAKSSFQDSLTCINYAYPEKVHPCSACHLIDFVPDDKRQEEVPCHFIPLNESGDTLDQLDAEEDQHKLEEALKAWLRARISEIKAAREAVLTSPKVS